jgi:CRISPR-associated protein Csx17
MDAERFSATHSPLDAALGLSSYDVMPFLWGECDDTKIEELLWGFTLIDWRKPGQKAVAEAWREPLVGDVVSRTWALLKLLVSPLGVRGVQIRREPRITHLVQAGRLCEACQLAVHRLRVSGLDPFEVDYEDELDPTRLLASLFIPVRGQTQLEHLVLAKKSATA